MTDDRPSHDLPAPDPALGAALRALPAPDHGPGFFDALQTQLAALDAEPGSRGAQTEPLGPDVVVPLGGSRRRWRRHTLRLAVVAAAAGVIGVAIGVNFDGPPSLTRDDDGPPISALPATAVDVTRRVQAALSSVETLRGVIAFRDADGEVRSRFVVTDDGDFRQSGLSRREELAYDAITGIERSYYVDPAGPDFGGERTGIAPGRPDGGPANWVLRRELGATVRALLYDRPEVTVQETTYDGRDAWLLDTDVEPNKIGGGADHLSITVDQDTGYPVMVVETINGAFFREVRLSELVTNAGEVDRSEFTIDFPPGVEVSRFDEGWRRLSNLDEVRSAVGYAPLVPGADALPEGFTLQQISVADSAQGTGVEGLNPPTREAVSLAFHRGLDQVLVTTRLRGPIVAGREPGPAPPACTDCLGDSSWSDPLASGEGFVDDPEELSVPSGALAGAPAQLLIGAHAVPHVWALGDSLVVTVSGDVTRDDLLGILGSLAPHSP